LPAAPSGCRSITFGPDISSIGSTSSPIGTAGKIVVDVAREALDDTRASITERHARFRRTAEFGACAEGLLPSQAPDIGRVMIDTETFHEWRRYPVAQGR
jgi:hypothetical protein